MDQNQGIGRLKVVELGFNTTRMLFTFGNLAAIAIDALADLSDGSKLALSVAVVILNISCVLSFVDVLRMSQLHGPPGSIALGVQQAQWLGKQSQ